MYFIHKLQSKWVGNFQFEIQSFRAKLDMIIPKKATIIITSSQTEGFF